MIEYDQRSYRPNVGIIVKNSDHKVFMGERFDNPYSWQFPQGGIDENEDFVAAAFRELQEETNITSVKILAQANDWLYYDIPLHLANKFWGGIYRGQKQKWFLMEFTGDYSEIKLDVHHDIEFKQYRFFDIHQAPSLTVPFKQAIYQQLIKEFAQWF